MNALQISVDNSFKRVDFNKNEFDSKIQQKGYDVYWEQMTLCPCRKESSAQPDIDCSNCNGSGYFYLTGKTIRALVSGIGLNKGFINWTENLTGTANMTTVAENRIGWMDRITVLSGESMFSEIIKKETLEVNDETTNWVITKYNVNSLTTVLGFIRANTDLENLVSKSIIDSGNKKKIILPSTTSSSSVSLLYQYNPVYFVIDVTNDYRNSFVKNIDGGEKLINLPLHCIIKKAHLTI